MAEIDPRLTEILGDQERLQQVLDLAQMLRGRGGDAPAPAAATPPAPMSTADIFAAVAGGAGQGTPQPPQSEPSAAGPAPSNNLSGLMEVLPQLLQAFSGTGSSLPDEKVNLVQAIKPYASDHSGSFDRAIRMANIAKAAKSALNTLGSRQT